MAQVVTHARAVHGVEHIDTDTEQKMLTQIHDA